MSLEIDIRSICFMWSYMIRIYFVLSGFNFLSNFVQLCSPECILSVMIIWWWLASGGMYWLNTRLLFYFLLLFYDIINRIWIFHSILCFLGFKILHLNFIKFLCFKSFWLHLIHINICSWNLIQFLCIMINQLLYRLSIFNREFLNDVIRNFMGDFLWISPLLVTNVVYSSYVIWFQFLLYLIILIFFLVYYVISFL